MERWDITANTNHMKRIFLVLAMMVGISAVGVCQNNVNVNVENGTNGYKYINGVCSRDDIGGVEVGEYSDRDYMGRTESCGAVFTNYNNFRVTVMYELELIYYKSGQKEYSKKSGSIVLDAQEKRRVFVAHPSNGYSRFNVTGLIVRKLAQ